MLIKIPSPLKGYINYGFVPSLVNVPTNAVQGVAGLITEIVLVRIFSKNKILM